MASSKTRTWIWIIAGTLGLMVLALIAVAGAGVYFVAHHFKAERTTTSEALRAFEVARAPFAGERPLYELDSAEHPRPVVPLADRPSGTVAPTALHVLAWDPDEERLVRVSLPLWLLHLHRQRIDLAGRDGGFDLNRLDLDVDELQRIGPALVFDYRNRDGVRVLLWTQ
jgi:hypothetical protein